METKFGKIICTEVRTSDYQKEGTQTAVLKQKVKTIYTSSLKTNNGMDDSLFSFDLPGKETEYTETRVCFMLVPKGTKVEQVNEKLAEQPKARLQKILSTDPWDVIDKNQESGIQNNLTTLEKVVAKYIVKDAEGTLIDYHGQDQYRRIVFSLQGEEDLDMRTVAKSTPIVEEQPADEFDLF